MPLSLAHDFLCTKCAEVMLEPVPRLSLQPGSPSSVLPLVHRGAPAQVRGATRTLQAG